MAEDNHYSTIYDGERKENLMLSSSGMVNKLPYSYYNKNHPTISSYVFKEF